MIKLKEINVSAFVFHDHYSEVRTSDFRMLCIFLFYIQRINTQNTYSFISFNARHLNYNKNIHLNCVRTLASVILTVVNDRKLIIAVKNSPLHSSVTHVSQ